MAEIFYNNKQQQQITEDNDTDIGVCGLFILVVGDWKQMKGWYLAQAEIQDSFGTGQVVWQSVLDLASATVYCQLSRQLKQSPASRNIAKPIYSTTLLCDLQFRQSFYAQL